MKTALTIAGTDPTGGAGVQADLKTFLANGVFGMSAITSVVSQNTMGVTAICDMTPEFLGEELDAVFTDIFPDAVKIGMVSNKDLILKIAEKLKEYRPKNIVLDPVMVATAGSKLISDDAIETLITKLIPLADVITPNIGEAEILADMKINDEKDMEEAAKIIYDRTKVAILLKGGHRTKDANDLIYDGSIKWIKGKRVDNPNAHGTGCTLSSAIAANMAKGMDLEGAIVKAKDYVTGALEDGLDLGKGRGPLNHGYVFKEYFEKN
ncbi:bifunctional hydroxymethylpyrimidine kinase/phosphomethylpyrimidine kinase [Peptoniphilus sp.]|jgi:hydroxymethylpyrimidine/phosphomethylpyrimidine kinase|uniref:bifunctional hydroxymethylpyrimidine kinase/phosphomethylpyrimidine kinase n=1 Tax=Peptoniphilus sp. TaxID=1971214 RepID=UPI003D8B2A0E